MVCSAVSVSILKCSVTTVHFSGKRKQIMEMKRVLSINNEACLSVCVFLSRHGQGQTCPDVCECKHLRHDTKLSLNGQSVSPGTSVYVRHC